MKTVVGIESIGYFKGDVKIEGLRIHLTEERDNCMGVVTQSFFVSKSLSSRIPDLSVLQVGDKVFVSDSNGRLTDLKIFN